MNEQRFVVSDILWQRLEPHLPGKVSDAGATAKDNRMFLEAVFWRVRTGLDLSRFCSGPRTLILCGFPLESHGAFVSQS